MYQQSGPDGHPQRSIKAFELKFQNVSAILYEQNLPYCDGLKPRFNYQRLLKLLVLDHLDRSPLPAQEAHEILFRKLAELQRRGYLSVVGKGSGRFGLTLEHHLGIPQNSDKAADFMGIELKTKHDKSLQTLFSRVPTSEIYWTSTDMTIRRGNVVLSILRSIANQIRSALLWRFVATRSTL